MSKLWEFVKYYSFKVLKIWWAIIIFIIPSFKQKILESLQTFDPPPEFTHHIEKTLDWLNPWWKWVAVIILWVLHIMVIYKLWNRNRITSISVGLNDSYEDIMRKVEKFIPQKSAEFKESFSAGYKCLKDGHDFKTAISIHFGAYSIIRGFLIEYFSDQNLNAEISVEISEIRAKFENNFSELMDYNNAIGRNDNLTIDEHGTRQLIEKINDNLKSLFSNFKV